MVSGPLKECRLALVIFFHACFKIDFICTILFSQWFSFPSLIILNSSLHLGLCICNVHCFESFFIRLLPCLTSLQISVEMLSRKSFPHHLHLKQVLLFFYPMVLKPSRTLWGSWTLKPFCHAYLACREQTPEFMTFESSPVAQMVKRLPTMRETWVQSLGWEDLLEKEMATHSSILVWKIPWTGEPGQVTVHGVAKSRTD